MTVDDGRHPSVLSKDGDGRPWRRLVRPGKISDGTVENTARKSQKCEAFAHFLHLSGWLVFWPGLSTLANASTLARAAPLAKA